MLFGLYKLGGVSFYTIGLCGLLYSFTSVHEPPSMAYSGDSTLVFIETNLGTRVAVPIPADISVKDFKGELESVHLNCFPGYGSIRIDAMMVKRRSCYYYLPESLPLKYAFQGSSSNWFLQIQVHTLSIDHQSDSFKCNGVEVINHNSVDDGVTNLVEFRRSSSRDKNITRWERKKNKVLITPYRKVSLLKIPAVFHLWRKRKKRRQGNRRGTIKSQGLGYMSRPLIAKDIVTGAEAHWRKQLDSSAVVEALSEALSETVSVSGIINKYFSDYDEVPSSSRLPFAPVPGRHKERLNSSKDSKYSNIQPDLMSPVIIPEPTQVPHKVWQEKPDSKASREKHRKPEVGKRVLLASNSLGLTPTNERPVLSVCKFSDKRSVHRSAAMVRTLVFEIPDEGD